MSVCGQEVLRNLFSESPKRQAGRTALLLLSLDLLVEPGAAVRPPAIGGRDGNAENFGGFLCSEADEIAEFDQFGLLFVPLGEFLQRIIHRQQFLVFGGGGHFDFMNVESGLAAAVALGTLAPGVLNQDAPHGFRRRAEEVSATVPFLVCVADEALYAAKQGGRDRICVGKPV